MTRLFYRDDPTDVDYDPAPRVRHWCGSPECARCDDAANASAALDALHDDPALLSRQYPEHAAELLTEICALVGRHRDRFQTPHLNGLIGAEVIRLVDERLRAAARSAA